MIRLSKKFDFEKHIEKERETSNRLTKSIEMVSTLTELL